MNRRSFLGTSVLAAAPAVLTGAETPNQYIELRFYDLHNGTANQRQRLTQFLEQHHLPMTKRLGVGPVGYFEVYLGPDMPKIVTVASYSSLGDIETRRAARRADKEWKKAVQQVAADNPVYDRVESWLLRTFDAQPKLEVLPIEEGKAPRFFDLRIYESENAHKAALKVDMFNSGEVDIFRSSGISPIFLGETMFGKKMPNLAYMVAYDDWDARVAAWDKFGSHPDWKKMSSDPRWAGTVSNITNTHLTPLAFSPIR